MVPLLVVCYCMLCGMAWHPLWSEIRSSEAIHHSCSGITYPKIIESASHPLADQYGPPKTSGLSRKAVFDVHCQAIGVVPDPSLSVPPLCVFLDPLGGCLWIGPLLGAPAVELQWSGRSRRPPFQTGLSAVLEWINE